MPIDTPADLAAHPLLLFETPDGRPLRPDLRGGADHPLDMPPTLVSTDAEAVVTAAEAGTGVCFVPTFLVEPAVARGTLRRRPARPCRRSRPRPHPRPEARESDTAARAGAGRVPTGGKVRWDGCRAMAKVQITAVHANHGPFASIGRTVDLLDQAQAVGHLPGLGDPAVLHAVHGDAVEGDLPSGRRDPVDRSGVAAGERSDDRDDVLRDVDFACVEPGVLEPIRHAAHLGEEPVDGLDATELARPVGDPAIRYDRGEPLAVSEPQRVVVPGHHLQRLVVREERGGERVGEVADIRVRGSAA